MVSIGSHMGTLVPIHAQPFRVMCRSFSRREAPPAMSPHFQTGFGVPHGVPVGGAGPVTLTVDLNIATMAIR